MFTYSAKFSHLFNIHVGLTSVTTAPQKWDKVKLSQICE